jgi:membrane protease YdiL (CAAX protease family)
MALVLTALYERTGNLLAPITAHAGFNLLNFLRLSFSEGRQGDLYMIVITASLLAILLTALWLAVRHERV